MAILEAIQSFVRGSMIQAQIADELCVAVFAALYGLTSLREKLAKKASPSEGCSRIQDSDDGHVQSQPTGDQRGSRA